jgi:FAD:protein FMN transferase
MTSLSSAPRRRVEQIMGMAVVIELCDQGVDEDAIERAFECLRFVDATFSTYLADSDISRMRREELDVAHAHPAVGMILERCAQLRVETGGYFDAGEGATVDPSGLVKGWAIAGAVRVLEESGARNFCISAGGDLYAGGCSWEGTEWRVGIQHPKRRDRVAAVLGVRDTAVATSGGYERGGHIVDPHTGVPPEGILSVTVVGTDIACADAYATAAFAMGARAAEWCAGLAGYEAIVILADDAVLSTPGLAGLRRSAS